MPAGSFSTGPLYVDGVLSSQAWTPTSIPASGTLTTPAVNNLTFTIQASGYNGVIEVCVLKCDGTKCCFEFKWNKKPWIDIGIALEEHQPKSNLFAVSVSPKILDNPSVSGVKYISFGVAEEEAKATFFAISGADYNESVPEGNHVDAIETFMGKYNSFFVLRKPVEPNVAMGNFNLVFTDVLSKLGCTLFDEEGNVIYSGVMEISGGDTIHSAVSESFPVQSKMFEVLKLYPNPTEGKFTTQFAIGEQRDIEVRVIANDGRVLKAFELNGYNVGIHEKDFDVSGIPAGSYHVVFYSEGNRLNETLLIR